MLVSNCRIGSNSDDLIRRYFNKVEWMGWHLIFYAMVVTLLDLFPNQIFFVDKSKAGNTIRYWFCCIFQFSVWFTFVVMVVDHVILGSFLEYNDVFFGKINIHECGFNSIFCDELECETDTDIF